MRILNCGSYKPLISLKNAYSSALKIWSRVCLQLAPGTPKESSDGTGGKTLQIPQVFARFLACLETIVCWAQEHTVVPRHKGGHRILPVQSSLGESCPSEVANEAANWEIHVCQRKYRNSLEIAQTQELEWPFVGNTVQGLSFIFAKTPRKNSVILLHSYKFTGQQYPKVITNRSNSMCSSILRVKNNRWPQSVKKIRTVKFFW